MIAVDLNCTVIDPDIPGDKLEYFIADGDGELARNKLGRTTGKLTGIVEPLLALEQRVHPGIMIPNTFGEFDFGVKSFNGYESFYYDTTFYDYATNTKSQRNLIDTMTLL